MKKKTKKIISMLLSFALLISTMCTLKINVQAADQFFSGEGTVDNPYIIGSAGDLQRLAEVVNSSNESYNDKNYKMINNIDLSGVEDWTPIGTGASFYGVFDGNGNKISNLHISSLSNPNIINVGIFGQNYGTIKNLGLVDSKFEALDEGIVYTGGIVAYNGGTITSCYNAGTIQTALGNGITGTGGVAGYNAGTISNCYNSGIVTDLKNAYATGGISAFNSGTINSCYNTGKITGSNGNAAGISGESVGAITNSYNKGNISAPRAAGIFSDDSMNGAQGVKTTTNCYNTGAISGGAAGGIACASFNQIIKNCYNTGAVSGYSTGGILWLNSGKISYCYNIGNVTSLQNDLAGICNNNGANASNITNCYFINNVNSGILNGNISTSVYGRTLEQMKIQSTFSGFDFTNTWVMPSGVATTPLLKSLYVPLTGITLKDTTLLKNQKAYILQPVPANASFTDCTWSSSNTDVATVDSNGLITPLKLGKAFIFATSKQGSYSAYCAVTVVQGVESIALPENENVIINESKTLEPAILPTDAYNKNIVWSSSNPKIATVDSNGKVCGLQTGNAVITASAVDGSGKEAQCTVTVVRPVTGISLDSSDSTLFVGKSLLISPTISPQDASNKAVTWTTSDSSIATVDSDGYILGVGRGEVTITATTVDGGYSSSKIIQVIQPVTSIALNDDSIGMDPGENYKLVANVLPADANDTSINWTSTNEAVATVSEDGTVNALAQGIAIIVAHSADGQTASHCAVLVGDTPFNDLIKTKVSNQKVQNSGYDSLSISWAPIQTATGYEVYSSETPDGNYAKVEQNEGIKGLTNSFVSTLATDNNQSITISGLKNGKALYFKVRGYFNYNGYNIYSEFSDPFVGKPQVGIVNSPKAEVASYDSVKVSWLATEGAQGYAIYRASSLDGQYSIINKTSNTSYVDSKLITGQSYYYKIKAYSNLGTEYENYSGSYSQAVSAKPIVSAPGTVKATSAAYNSINLSWSSVNGANGYDVYKATSSTGTYTLAGSTTSTSFNNTGLTTNAIYYYKIKAYRLVGSTKVYSEYSSFVSGKPIPSIAASVTATSSGYNSVKVSWSAVNGANGYEIYKATSSTGTYTLAGSTTSTSLNNTGLTTNTTYYYKVKAYRLVGSTKVYSEYSSFASAKPIPGVATSVTAASSGYNSVKVSWGSVNGANGYEVYKATSSAGNYAFVGSTTLTSLNNTGLTTNTTYYYKIKAYRLVGNIKVYSGFCAVVSAKPVPSVPVAFKAVRLTSTSNKLTWSGVTGASGYQIYRATSSTGTYSLIKTVTNVSYTDTGLSKGKTYYYKIRTYRLVGKIAVYSNWTAVAFAKVY